MLATDALDTKKFEKGKCFICMQNCDADAYVHVSCAVAYHDEKAKRIKNAQS